MPTVTQDSEGGSEAEDLHMPKMVNLETAGQRRTPRLASQSTKKYTFASSLRKFCAYGLLVAAIMMQPVCVFSHAHACINSAVYQCNVINANFDGSLNAIHHMVLAAGRSNNEVYTYREMLKQDDASDFIKAMTKEISDHESR